MLLEKEQTGFRAALGCEVNVMKLINSLKNRIRHRRIVTPRNGKIFRKVWSLYIDLKSAFDSVTHWKLFSKMKNLGIRNNLINTIAWLYNATKFGVNNQEVPIGKGLI